MFRSVHAAGGGGGGKNAVERARAPPVELLVDEGLLRPA